MAETPQDRPKRDLEDPAFLEELMRQSYGDPALFESNRVRLGWQVRIDDAGGANKLTPEEQEEYLEFQKKHTELTREVRNREDPDVVDPDKE